MGYKCIGAGPLHGNRWPIKAWVEHVPEIEASAMEQLNNCAQLPFIYKHIAVMPDVHTGQAATIGSVIPTRGAVIPAAVGVDIGCGMQAVRTNLRRDDLPDSLADMRSVIEASVPHGRTNHGQEGDEGAWSWRIPPHIIDYWNKVLSEGWIRIVGAHPKLAHERALNQLGTLGTGNHFIEVCVDTDDNVWVMLHSGSRGVGNRIASYFIKKAKEDMKRFFINLPDKGLAYLPEGTPDFVSYIKAVNWAQSYARLNRDLMMEATLCAMVRYLGTVISLEGEVIDCHHNYIAKENHFGANIWVTRKGAVRAREGDMGIIPGSMGARSFIVRGRGNRDSFHSCSHGAGRVMSRTKARNTITVEDHIKATQGVECSKDKGVLDESPAAYKDLDAVMASQVDLVEPVVELRQILVVKGENDK